MRLVHTSDWHLGRAFHGVSMLDAQAAFLEHLVELVRAERVDAVLVSGDVYDRAMPAPDTVALLSEAVTGLVDAGAVVVLSSGNHDSAIRLGFAAPLLARAGLHIRSSVADVGVPVLVGDTAVYPLPYLEPALAAPALGVAQVEHAAVLRAAMRRVAADRHTRHLPAVVMAHAFVAGGLTSDSERDIAVGGVGAVPPSVFRGIDYVALGHLHRPQALGERIRYSGSPLAWSFGERGHTKGSWLVDVAPGVGDEGAAVSAQFVPAPLARPIAVLRGDLEGLLTDPALAESETAWCQVVLTDAVRPLGAMDRVRVRFPHTLSLAFEPTGAVVDRAEYAARRVHEKPELDVCAEFLTHVRGGAGPDPAEFAVLGEAVEGSRVRRAEHDDEGGLGLGRVVA